MTDHPEVTRIEVLEASIKALEAKLQRYRRATTLHLHTEMEKILGAYDAIVTARVEEHLCTLSECAEILERMSEEDPFRHNKPVLDEAASRIRSLARQVDPEVDRGLMERKGLSPSDRVYNWLIAKGRMTQQRLEMRPPVGMSISAVKKAVSSLLESGKIYVDEEMMLRLTP